MSQRTLRTSCIAVLAWLACCTAAQAHPHLLIAQRLHFIASNGQFTHVEVEWAFDPFSSDLEIAAVDDDKDNRLSAQEERELAKIALPELKRFGYLTWLATGGKDERPTQAPTFKARIDNPASFVPGGWTPTPDAGGKLPSTGAITGGTAAPAQPGMRNLVYVLRYPLTKPSKSLSVTAIDTDDYIRIELAPANSFRVSGDGGKAACRADKHPEIKAEYVRGYPFFADRVTCTLP